VTLTRREFLHGIAAVGGAGAALGAMEALELTASPARAGTTTRFAAPARSDFELRGRVNDARVLVLGAGISGLVGAYELEKAGYRVELLEARSRPGGRSWTVRSGTTEVDVDGNRQTARFAEGSYMNAGPARIAQHHLTLDYCRELGVPVEVFVNANPNAYYFQERPDASGRLTGRAIRQRAAKVDHYGYVSELLAKAVNRGALDRELTRDDRERLVEFLRAFGALGSGDRYVASSRRGPSGPAGPHPAHRSRRPFDLSDLLASAVGLSFPFEAEWDQAMPMFQPVGGMDRIAYALADAVKGKIRYGAEVRSIATTDDGVKVVFRDADGKGWQIEADYCLCSIPPMVLRSISSNFAADVKTALRSLQGVPTGKLGLEYRRRFWEEDEGIFGGITSTNMDIDGIWYPSSGYLGRSGVLIGYYNHFDAASAYGALTPAARERRALAQGRKIHGTPYVKDFRASFSVEWSRVRYSLGGWVAWPGDSRDVSFRRLLERQGNLWFCGDHLSDATAWQHGAIQSARAAVTALHKRALAR
jgi:monoamine oxidase